MIKHGEPNPLSVFGLRRLSHCPPHFVRIPFELRTDIKHISDWIWENLEGRFWLDVYCYHIEPGKAGICYCAGFESGGEASYFSLMLDQINHYNLDSF